MLLITNYFWAFIIKLNYLLFNLFLFKDSNWTSRIKETDEKVFVEYLNSEESVCDVGIYRNVTLCRRNKFESRPTRFDFRLN